MTKYAAFGTDLMVGDGAGAYEEFTSIGQLKDITGPNMTRSTIDVTTHDSPEGYLEFLPSLRDGGEVTFEVELDPNNDMHAGASGLLGMFNDDEVRNWRLVFPVEGDTGGWQGLEFTGFVTQFSTSEPVTGSLRASITVKVAGATELVEFTDLS